MKTVNNSIKQALKKPTTQRKGRILVNGNYYDVFNVEYYSDCYDEGKVIGNAIASQLDFEMPYIEKFDTFQYFDGVWTGTNYEYVNFGTFTVFDEKDEDTFNKHITAFDNLIKFNTLFEPTGTYPKTLYTELYDLCTQAGVTLGTLSIPNGNFVVSNNQFVSGESKKTVLKQICAISGTYATVKNNVLYLQLKNTTNEILEKNQHTPVDWKRRSYGINQVIIGDSQIEGEYVIRQDDEDIALHGVHKLEILDNLFAYTQDKRQQLIDGLYNQVHGFGYIPYETQGEWLNYLEVGDTITIDNIETLVLRINGKTPKSVESTISAPAIIDSSIEYVDNTNDIENQLKRTAITVDKQNQTITSVVSQTIDTGNPDSAVNKVSRLTQRVDELESEISNISGMTMTKESELSSVTFDDTTTESEPISIKVHPINESISYLYPRNNLYPSSTTYLKNRKIRFHNNTTNENIDYELPDDLLYYDSTHYDELFLSYESETCQITKRCKYNADGTIGLLSNERIDTYTYPEIHLTEGVYSVYLLGYTNGYIYITLMAKNIYTDQFYTKVETGTLIDQRIDGIDLESYQKFTDLKGNVQENTSNIAINSNSITSEVTRATQEEGNLSSRISQTATGISLTVNNGSTSSGIVISVAKEDGTTTQATGTIQMTGLVKFTDLSGNGTTTINGNNITTGIIKSNNYISGTSGTSINLSTGVIDTKNFKISNTGNITATAGSIGGWGIETNRLESGSDDTYVRLDTNPSINTAIWCGAESAADAPFRVSKRGTLRATNAEIIGTITATSGSFTGEVHATSGSFTGTITSGNGSIGGWTISSNKLGGDNTYLNPNGDFAFYHNHRVIGSNGNVTINSQQGKGLIICDGIISPTDGNVTMSASNASRLRFVSTTNGIQIRTSAISIGFNDNDAKNCLTGIMKLVTNTSGTNVTHYFVFRCGMLIDHSTSDPSSSYSGYTKWY